MRWTSCALPCRRHTFVYDMPNSQALYCTYCSLVSLVSKYMARYVFVARLIHLKYTIALIVD